MSFADRRAQRRWRREMERHLRELERRDERLHLDDGPQVHRPEGAPIPLPRGRGARPPRARKQHGPVAPGLLVVGVILVGVFLLDPSANGQRLRELVGFGGTPAGDGAYAFAATQAGSDNPVTWNPCRDIEYVVNPAGAPDDWRDLVDAAIRDIEGASAFDFTDTGTSDERDFDDRTDALGRAQPVLIGWADDEEVPRLAGDVAGLGGATYVQRNGRRTYVTGSIALDSELFAELDGDRHGDELMRAIVTHELGHVLGLDHVEDAGELMYSDNVGQTELGPGDREGLARLGDAGCG
jgi:hypothetical protein